MSVIVDRPVSDLAAAGALFAALGRTILCLDAAFTVVYCSSPDARPGQPAAELLGDDLFGPLGTLRQILERGETREGWRAVLYGTREQVSLAAAPCALDNVRYLVTLRTSEEDGMIGSSAPMMYFGVVARSSAMLDIVAVLEVMRLCDAPLFIAGEEGTGKKTIARALHAASRRRGRFVPLDCGILSPELVSLDAARGGTLYLSDVCKLTPPLQAKLLRVLDTGETRIVTACTGPVATLRDDLAQRLRAAAIEVPPLRARADDIEPLAQHLLARVAARHGRALRLAPESVRALIRYTWPGNVRELESAIEHAAVVATSSTIAPEDLPDGIGDGVRERSADTGELQQIRAALDANHWNREATARSLGMSRTTLWRKMRELRLV